MTNETQISKQVAAGNLTVRAVKIQAGMPIKNTEFKDITLCSESFKKTEIDTLNKEYSIFEKINISDVRSWVVLDVVTDGCTYTVPMSMELYVSIIEPLQIKFAAKVNKRQFKKIDEACKSYIIENNVPYYGRIS